MSDKLRESMSAMMDDEAHELELRRVVKSLEYDEELKQTWVRYHQARRVVQEQKPAAEVSAKLEDKLNAGLLSQSIRAAIDNIDFEDESLADLDVDAAPWPMKPEESLPSQTYSNTDDDSNADGYLAQSLPTQEEVITQDASRQTAAKVAATDAPEQAAQVMAESAANAQIAAAKRKRNWLSSQWIQGAVAAGVAGLVVVFAQFGLIEQQQPTEQFASQQQNLPNPNLAPSTQVATSNALPVPRELQVPTERVMSVGARPSFAPGVGDNGAIALSKTLRAPAGNSQPAYEIRLQVVELSPQERSQMRGRLQEYLLRHYEVTADQSEQGLIPFAQAVGDRSQF